MGFAASQARLLSLTARKSDLELQLQLLNQGRMQLSNQMSNLFNGFTPQAQQAGTAANTNTNPESPQQQEQLRKLVVIQNRDKMMEMMSQQITMQHTAVQTEVDAVQKVIQKNIESSFKLMG